MFGFDSVKDLLEVLIVPLSLFFFGLVLSRLFVKSENRRRNRFLLLIRREMQEMKPEQVQEQDNRRWCELLRKRFIHERIFLDPNANCEFVLSLEPELAYHESQMWTAMQKAGNAALRASTASDLEQKDRATQDLKRQAEFWSFHLKRVCAALDGREDGALCREIWNPWHAVIDHHYPGLWSERTPQPQLCYGGEVAAKVGRKSARAAFR